MRSLYSSLYTSIMDNRMSNVQPWASMAALALQPAARVQGERTDRLIDKQADAFLRADGDQGTGVGTGRAPMRPGSQAGGCQRHTDRQLRTGRADPWLAG
jgi:hypothetical protein